MTSLHEVLVELVGRVDHECTYVVDDRSASDGWHRLDGLLADAGPMDGVLEALVDGVAAGHRDVAGSYLASWLTGPIVHLLAAAWLDGGRVVHLDVDELAMRFHEEGWVDGVAIAGARLTVDGTDPVAVLDGVDVVEDLDRRRRLVVDQIRSVAGPIFTAVRDRVPYGRSGMWGSLADGVAVGILHSEQRRPGGGDPAGAWAAVDALLDELAQQTLALRARPRRQLIAWSGGTWHQTVRGTCCLYYKTSPDPDPCGDGYCSSCPLRPDESRAERITGWLEAQHA
jgi:hypothetical protein